MFDILLYLYDTYLLTDQIPDAEHLSRKLSAAGFEMGDITEALDWLSGLDDLQAQEENAETAEESDGAAVAQPSVRVYSEEEAHRIDIEGRGFLTFLESAQLLPPHGREWVIEQALALPDADVSAERIKWIALLALWKLKGVGDVLWLEDLVRGTEDGWRPTLH
jgi:Smg protein